MRVIDGSFGESGGQILRTALGLSVLTQIPCEIKNIRQKRKVPGLSEQHVQVIKALQSVCNADVSGNSLHSTAITFVPQGVSRSKNLSVTISTAGSVGLVLQSLLIAASKQELQVAVFGGGTFGEWAPPVMHVQKVLLPLLERFGYTAMVTIEKEGFFPRGGAFVRAITAASSLHPIVLKKPVQITKVEGISIAAESLREKRVAERQAQAAEEYIKKVLPDVEVAITTQYVRSLCPGSGVQLWAATSEGIIGGDSVGKLRVSAEQVGESAAKRLVSANGFAVDKYTADQLIPYMGLGGGGELFVEGVTEHARTNAWVVEQFLPVQFEFEEHWIRCRARS